MSMTPSQVQQIIDTQAQPQALNSVDPTDPQTLLKFDQIRNALKAHYQQLSDAANNATQTGDPNQWVPALRALQDFVSTLPGDILNDDAQLALQSLSDDEAKFLGLIAPPKGGAKVSEADIQGAVDAVNSGQYDANDVKTLKDAGLITPTIAAKYLAALGGGTSPGTVSSGGSAKAPKTAALPYGGLTGDFAEATKNATPEELAALQQLAASGKRSSSSGGGAGSGGGSAAFQHVVIGGQAYTFDPNTGQYTLGVGLDPTAPDAATGRTPSEMIAAGNFIRGLANDSYDRAADPGNFPAYLAAMSGMKPGAGSPIDQILGAGTTISAPEGSNPLADPRFQKLLDSIYGTDAGSAAGTTPAPAPTVGAASQADPWAALRGYTPEQNAELVKYAQLMKGASATPPVNTTGNALGIDLSGLKDQQFDPSQLQIGRTHATGGSQMLNGPVVGIPQDQLLPGQTPQFLAGEAGKEKLTFTPMPSPMGAVPGIPEGVTPTPGLNLSGVAMGSPPDVVRTAPPGIVDLLRQAMAAPTNRGWQRTPPNDAHWQVHQHENELQIPIPHQHAFGAMKHEHLGGITQYADGGSAIAGSEGSTYTPAEGTNVALGRALKSGGYGQTGAIDQLLGGHAATPGSIDEATYARLPWSLRELLSAGVKAQVGRSGLMDYLQRLQEYQLPGGASQTSTVYQ